MTATGIALNLSCVSSLTVPTQVPSTNGYVTTGKDCCKDKGIDCSDYDGCRSEGEKYNPQTGIYEESCSCYDKPTPSEPHEHPSKW